MKIQTKYRRVVREPAFEHNALSDSIRALEPKAVAQSIPLTWRKAEDFCVFDDQGNKYLDMTSGIFVTNSGHANRAIRHAIRAQLDSGLLFAYNYPTRIKDQFLKKLLGLSPKYFNRAILLNSGSEAVDTAYKLVKLWAAKHGKRHIVTFNGSYHGRGLSNDLICGRKDKASWSGVKDDTVHFLPFPYEGSARFDPKSLPRHDRIAAFFLETFQGWGAWFYPPGYVNDLCAFARRVGALVCFDEMQAGFYRLGPLYGYMSYGPDIRPDIICLGKGLASCLPISAVLSRKDIVDIDPSADLHGTHSGNPLCCAAALANLRFLSQRGQLAGLRRRIRVFEGAMNSLAGLPSVRQVNARGLIAGIIFDKAETATAIVRACVRQGVLPVCTNRNSIKLAPPLTIAPDAIQEAVAVLRGAILETSGPAHG